MKVYTKTGDKGMTSLIGGERVFKTDERVEAYGTVDELAAFTALLADNMRGDAALASSVGDLNRILSRLMSVEALLATGQSGSDKVAPLDPETVAWLEGRIDAMQEVLKPIDKFTIPGGNAVVSMCHVCRTVCRRAERAALRADARYGEIVLGGVVGPDVFDRFVDFTLVFYLLQVFEHFERRTRTYCIVDEFIFRCGPGGIFEFRCQFKRPIHSHNIFKFPIVNGLFVLKGC